MLIMYKSNKSMITALLLFGALLFLFIPDVKSEPAKATLIQSVMCEAIKNFQPVNPAVVFSISQGEVFCFSKFDPVIEKTFIFHKWYKRDKLIFTMQLTLSPPKWSSFSRIQIRNADKGPWRVEIWNENNWILDVTIIADRAETTN